MPIFRSPVSPTNKTLCLPSASGVLPQFRTARMIGFGRAVRQGPRIRQVPLALLVTRGNATTALLCLRAVCRVFSASLYCVGNGLVTGGRDGTFRDWFQEVEVRAQLVVLKWEIYFQSRAVAKPGIALAWGARGPEFKSRQPDQLKPFDIHTECV